MSTDRDAERIVRSWLEEGLTRLPDRVLDLVLDQIPATPQRRAGWLARRFRTMSNTIRYAAAGVAIAAAVIIGALVLVPRTDVGPPPGATPQTTAEPTAIQTPSVASLYRSAPVTLPAGDYEHSTFFAPFTFTVPAGWTGITVAPGVASLVKTRDGEPFVAGLSVTAINGVFSDTCLDSEPMSPAPATVDEVVDAFTHQVGMRAGPVTTVALGAYQAKVFDIENSIDAVTCPEGASQPWTQWTYLEQTGVTAESRDGTGWHSRMWVLDVDGTLILIYAVSDPVSTSQTDGDELYRMAGSVRFK